MIGFQSKKSHHGQCACEIEIALMDAKQKKRAHFSEPIHMLRNLWIAVADLSEHNT